MIDTAKLFSISYLLEPIPVVDIAYFWYFVSLFVFLFIGGFLFSLLLPLRQTPVFLRLGQWFRWLGFIALALLFFRYQGLPYLSMRILWYLLAGGFLLWLAVIVRDVRRLKPKLEEQTIRQQTYDKYLPRPKHSVREPHQNPRKTR